MDELSHDEREIRAARNQSIFRAVNAQLRELTENLSSFSGNFAIACECADRSCTATLAIRQEEYEAMRASPRQFAVRPRHVDPEVDRVVRKADGYVVVEKVGAAANVAEILAQAQ